MTKRREPRGVRKEKVRLGKYAAGTLAGTAAGTATGAAASATKGRRCGGARRRSDGGGGAAVG